MFQNPGVGNVRLHNHYFEQVVDIISSVTGQLLHEKVFGLFIENAVPINFLLIFGSGRVLNLNTEAHIPLIVDKSLGINLIGLNLWDILIVLIFRMFIFQTIFLVSSIFRMFLVSSSTSG
jgi:hypothetical protein